MSNRGPAPKSSGVVHMAATVWLIIGLLVLGGLAIGVVASIRANVAAAAPVEVSPERAALTKRENDYWSAYQATSLLGETYPLGPKKDRAGALVDGQNICSWKARDPKGYAAYLDPSHTAERGNAKQLAIVEGARIAEMYLCV